VVSFGVGVKVEIRFSVKVEVIGCGYRYGVGVGFCNWGGSGVRLWWDRGGGAGGIWSIAT